jgi:adenylate cyclase class 2
VNYEVERKYWIEDERAIVQGVAALGGSFGPPEFQSDTYYAHPARDFAATDEALRIRRVGPVANFTVAKITYKGPKIDSGSKTRREIEIELSGGVEGARQHADLLEALGFRPVAEVTKHRRTATLAWQGHSVEIALDTVQPLGVFVELETSADDSGLTAAQQSLCSLAERLSLHRDERRSYLELLLART